MAEDDDLHAFTARLPSPAYDAMKSYAAMTQRTLSDVLADAVLAYLADRARHEQLEAIHQRTVAKFRETIERLAGN